MWMLNFVPDALLVWIVNLILFVGLAGTLSSYFIKFIPPLIPYSGLVRTAGIILLVIGVYLRGGYGVEMEWRQRAADLAAKIAVSEQQSKDANVKLDAAIKEKTKFVKEVQVVIQERVRVEAAAMDAQCTVNNSAISILNDAAKNVKGAGK